MRSGKNGGKGVRSGIVIKKKGKAGRHRKEGLRGRKDIKDAKKS